MDRRHFLSSMALKSASAIGLGSASGLGFASGLRFATGIPSAIAADKMGPPADLETFVPTRAITQPPGYHWFGYYDKLQFSPDDRLVLSNRVDFEGRQPEPADKITVGYVDTANDDRWVSLGESSAWGWQQGCMLQWIPGTKKQLIWNDQEGDSFVSRRMDLDTGETTNFSRPIYTIAPNGKFALTVDFSRLDNLRPGYGYSGLQDEYVDQPQPKASGIWKLDLETGKEDLILSLADVADIAWNGATPPQAAWHYFNHLLINPSGTRFIVLHRYRPKFDPNRLQFEGGFVTRMLTAAVDGSDARVVDASGNTSHFIWKNDQFITMWTKPSGMDWGFYDFEDKTAATPLRLGAEKMPTNGHNTYLPDPYGDWILNDTYPSKTGRRQTVYLYHPATDRRIDLGHFPSPRPYKGPWRCDTHPRTSRDGKTVCIDSPHQGGRQLYLLDLTNLPLS